MSEILAGGGPCHRHVEPGVGPGSRGMAAYEHRWNTVARSSCGHLWVRRYTWVGMLVFGWLGGDHYPTWVRLRPWHVVALLRVLGRRVVHPRPRDSFVLTQAEYDAYQQAIRQVHELKTALDALAAEGLDDPAMRAEMVAAGQRLGAMSQSWREG